MQFSESGISDRLVWSYSGIQCILATMYLEELYDLGHAHASLLKDKS